MLLPIVVLLMVLAAGAEDPPLLLQATANAMTTPSTRMNIFDMRSSPFTYEQIQ
jgi:hypothetical protein